MADESDIIIDIQLNYGDAVNKIVEYKDKIAEAEKQMKAYAEQIKNGNIKNQEEYKKSIVATKAEISAYKDSIKILEREVKNNVRAENEMQGSFDMLKAILSASNAELGRMSEEQRKNSQRGQELAKTIAETTEKLKEEEFALGNFRRDVGNYEKASVSLKGELKSLIQQLAEMKLAGKDNSIEYQNLVKRAGELKDAIGDANTEIGNFANDTSSLTALNQSVQSVVGAYGLYKAAASSVGIENEEMDATIVSMTKVMAVLSAATALQNALQKESAMMTKLNSAATAAANLVMKVFGVTTTTTSLAFKGLKLAIAATGIGLFVVLIGTLIANWDKLTAAFKTGTDGMSMFGKAFAKVKEIAVGVFEVIKNYILAPMKTLGKLMEGDFKGAFNEIKNGFDTVGNYQKGANEQMIKNQQNAAKAKIEYEKRTLGERLLNGATALEKQLEIDKAMGISAQELYKREMAILEQKKQGYAEALKFIKNTNGDEYKEMLKNIDDTNQEIAVKNATEIKRRSEDAKQQAATAKERRNIELAAIRQAQDSEFALLKESKEKERQAIEFAAARQIEDLKRRLATEKNLSTAARQSINSTIVDLEKKKNLDITALNKKYSDEEIERLAGEKQKIIELKLSAAKKESEDEYNLNLEKLNSQYTAEIASTEKTIKERLQKIYEGEELEKKVAEELSGWKILLENKHNAQVAELEKTKKQKQLADQKAAIELEVQQKLLGVIAGSEQEAQINQEASQAEYDRIVGMDAATKEALGLSDTAYEQMKIDSLEKLKAAQKSYTQVVAQTTQTQLASVSSIASSFSDLFEQLADDNETMATFSKLIALFQIGVDMSRGIAGAIAEGAKAGPFPANLAAIATGISVVTTGIINAKKLLSKEKEPKAPKFSTGGYISGVGSGTSDSIPAMLSNGESVMNAVTTAMFAPLLSSLNQIGGGIPIQAAEVSQQVVGEEMLSQAFAKAIQLLPNPVVGVDEITRVTKRVQVNETVGAV